MTDPAERDDAAENTDVDDDGIEDDGWVRLEQPRLIPPGLPRAVAGGAAGVVQDDRTIDVDGFAEAGVQVPEDAGLPPGTDVEVALRDGQFHARSQAAAEQHQQRQQRRQELRQRAKDRARARRQRQAKAEAEAFWSQYEIPVAFTVAIKGRRSGLSKGSWGDGRAADTVNHLFLQESVDDGRLQRDADSYLCDDAASFRFTEPITREGPEGEEYTPPVTCEKCLTRMERWKLPEDATSGGDKDES